MSSGYGAGLVRPGGHFVVGGVGFEAAVKDADEPVGELAQGGVVVGAAGALSVGRCTLLMNGTGALVM